MSQIHCTKVPREDPTRQRRSINNSLVFKANMIYSWLFHQTRITCTSGWYTVSLHNAVGMQIFVVVVYKRLSGYRRIQHNLKCTSELPESDVMLEAIKQEQTRKAIQSISSDYFLQKPPMMLSSEIEEKITNKPKSDYSYDESAIINLST